MKTYKLCTGWASEDKRSGFGDGDDTSIAEYLTFAAADAALVRFANSCGHSQDRGDRWIHDVASVWECEDGVEIGQPIWEFRSRPKPQEVAS